MLTEELLTEEYDAWKSRHVQTCADGSSIVVKDGSVVSEGIAYGMLLAAGFLDRPLFDGLWQYYTDHVDANGLMNWATSLCEGAGNNNANAAADAELDAAMALIQAHAVWPDGSYLAAAEDLTQRILDHETDVCDDKLVLLPGDAWGGCNDSDTRINPSYFAPGYYRVFAAKFSAQAEAWNQLLENTYALYASYQAQFPLVPDWDNHPYGDEGSLDHYNYDACRTPWRLATEYAFSGDSRAATFLQSVSSWVDANGGIGSPGGRANNSAFNGAFALSAVTDAAKLDSYVADWLSSGGDDGPYFQGTLRVLYMLVGAGRFPSTL
jgi:endo-1,4-beta-D-glucanase Y